MSSAGRHDSPATEGGREPPHKRSRSAVACLRCKERRQKCDNAQPACGNCTKSGNTCVFGRSDAPAWHVRALESQVAALEQRLALYEPSSSADHLDPRPPPRPPSPAGAAAAAAAPAAGPSTSAAGYLGSSLGFLSLLASGEPYYLGASGGLSLGHLVQAAVYERPDEQQLQDQDQGQAPASSPHQPSPASSSAGPSALPRPEDRPFSCHVPKPTTRPAVLPAPALGHSLLSAYLSAVHRLYPFLDPTKLARLHLDSLADPAAEPTSRPQKMARLKLHLVYAIGARHLQLSSNAAAKFEVSLPEAHFVAAVKLLDQAFDLRGVENIETLLLLAVYSLHSPSGPGVWHVCGLALRSCVEMGMHRHLRSVPADRRPHDQRRKRLFWSSYVLERRICITLGRPFSLADADIDVELPSTADTSAVGEDPDLPIALPPASLLPHVNLIKLQQIISRIQTTNGRVSETSPPSAEAIAGLRLELERWSAAAQAEGPSEPLTLEYFKALRILLQPTVMQPRPSRRDVLDCARAAGQVCQSYKRLHQGEGMGMNLLDLHDLLVAGIQVVFCAWLDPRAANPYALSADLGACSTVLFLCTTRWASARAFRDAFENLTAKTIEHLQRSFDSQQQAAAAAPTPPPADKEPIGLYPDQVDVLAAAGGWGGGVDDDLWRMLSEMTGAPMLSSSGGGGGGGGGSTGGAFAGPSGGGGAFDTDYSWMSDPSFALNGGGGGGHGVF